MTRAETLPGPVGVLMVPLTVPFATVASMLHPGLVSVNRFVVVSNVPVSVTVVVDAPENFAVPLALTIASGPMLDPLNAPALTGTIALSVTVPVNKPLPKIPL